MRIEVTRKKKSRSTPGTPRASESARRTKIVYLTSDSVASFMMKVQKGAVLDLVQIERQGVRSRFLRDMAAEMGIRIARLYEVLGVTNASLNKKAVGGARVTGMGAQAALNMARLLGSAKAIAERSTASANFDAAKWLGQWIEVAQPALGGQRPADLMDTPTGREPLQRYSARSRAALICDRAVTARHRCIG